MSLAAWLTNLARRADRSRCPWCRTPGDGYCSTVCEENDAWDQALTS
jgi:hypothetical protein